MDTTDVKALMSQNITEMDAVVLAIGENFEATVLTAVHLMDLGC
jgi:trk system potassium uptake protein